LFVDKSLKPRKVIILYVDLRTWNMSNYSGILYNLYIGI